MRILFLTDDFYPNFGANSLIVKALAEQLIADGHAVLVMPFAASSARAASEDWQGIRIIRSVHGDGKAALWGLLKRFRIGDAVRILVNRLAKKAGKRSVRLKEIVSARQAVERVIKKNQVDLVVSVHCSVECSFPIYHLKKKKKTTAKWLYYMLDPFATHSYYGEHYDHRELGQVQHEFLASCDKVLCSDIIAEEIAQTESEEIIKKLEVAEYPKIQDLRAMAKPIALDDAFVHCVCLGTFNQAVRPADYFFEVVDRLRDSRFLFHFLGNGWGDDNPFSVPERTNCVFHGRVTWEEAISFACGCDCLINVGNRVQNQFPSKLLEYVCTGNPIVDFSKYHSGLTEKCLTTYPRALILYEDEPVDIAAEKLRRFAENKQEKVDYQTVKELFPTATPAYVAAQIEKIEKENGCSR